jgi:hypothetical protein
MQRQEQQAAGCYTHERMGGTYILDFARSSSFAVSSSDESSFSSPCRMGKWVAAPLVCFSYDSRITNYNTLYLIMDSPNGRRRVSSQEELQLHACRLTCSEPLQLAFSTSALPR